MAAAPRAAAVEALAVAMAARHPPEAEVAAAAAVEAVEAAPRA
jgi:hypothetical protein